MYRTHTERVPNKRRLNLKLLPTIGEIIYTQNRSFSQKNFNDVRKQRYITRVFCTKFHKLDKRVPLEEGQAGKGQREDVCRNCAKPDRHCGENRNIS